MKTHNHNEIMLNKHITEMCSYYDKNSEKTINFYKANQKAIHEKISTDFYDKYYFSDEFYMNEIDCGIYDFRFYILDILTMLQDLNTNFIISLEKSDWKLWDKIRFNKLQINTENYPIFFNYS